MRRFCIWLMLLGIPAGSSPLLGSGESRTENVVALPPFLVEAEPLDGPHWLHGECSGLEILSAGEEDETQAFIQDLRTDLVYLHQLIPEEFLFKTALPFDLDPFSPIANGQNRQGNGAGTLSDSS